MAATVGLVSEVSEFFFSSHRYPLPIRMHKAARVGGSSLTIEKEDH